MKPRLSLEKINAKKPADSRLTAVELSNRPIKSRAYYVICSCTCGGTIETLVNQVTTGAAKSCGCLYWETRRKCQSSVLNKHIQRIWHGMRDRCNNPKNTNYKYYGAKGCIVCEDWNNNYQSFLDWSLNNGWQKGYHIDKDIKGDGKLYSPETCMFVPPKINYKAIGMNRQQKDELLKSISL